MFIMKSAKIVFYSTLILIIWAVTAFGQLSDTYYIDQNASGGQLFANGGRYFNSFSESVDALYDEGVSGAVTFEVAGGQVFTEQVQFDGEITGVSATNSLTYIYQGSNKPTLQPAVASAFEGVIDIIYEHDYHLTIDGIKVSASNGMISSARAIRVAGGPDYVTIRNCEVYDFLSTGIAMMWAFSHPDSVSENCVIEGNEVFNSTLTSTDAANVYGIISTGSADIRINNNKIYNLLAGTSNVYGIHATGDADSCNTDIYNNFVSLGDNINEDIKIYGIFSQQGVGPTINIHHNSVYLGGEVDSPTNFTTGVRLDNDASTNFYNNISFNERLQTGGTGNYYNYAIFINRAIYQYTANNNNLYSTGDFLGFRAGTQHNNLSAWQTATSQDVNSISVDPDYVGATDLHVLPISPVSNLGATTTGITTDIDGESRDFENPDIGADEFPDNRAPQITSTAVTSAVEDQQYSYQVTATDEDYADTLTFSLTQAPGFLFIDPVTGLMTGTPDNDDVADHDVTVLVSDLAGANDPQSYTLTVQNVNDAPTISDIGDQNTDEDNATGTIAFTVNDVDNAAGTLTVSGSSSNQALVPDGNFTFGGTGSNRTVVITPADNANGTATITITVSDGDLIANDTFVLTVNSINDSPVVSDIPDQTIEEGEGFEVIALNNFVNDVDHPDNEISWTRTGNEELTVDINATTHVVTITIPDANWNGIETITFTATDPDLASANDQVVLTVSSVNDPPTVENPIPNQTASEEVAFSYAFPANTFDDVDSGYNLTYAATLSDYSALCFKFPKHPSRENIHGSRE